ncbi:hypothetical protein GCM10009530_37790 [Microbispora corallina]|uniref:Uncharacterized protein n=1 Tax=Microbispora corallina TaxID=83302 RepID=A0ABQ4G2C1_9ACTN|nr:hypothetical protein Mco01_42280 [Microbispora corallina]
MGAADAAAGEPADAWAAAGAIVTRAAATAIPVRTRAAVIGRSLLALAKMGRVSAARLSTRLPSPEPGT